MTKNKRLVICLFLPALFIGYNYLFTWNLTEYIKFFGRTFGYRGDLIPVFMSLILSAAMWWPWQKLVREREAIVKKANADADKERQAKKDAILAEEKRKADEKTAQAFRAEQVKAEVEKQLKAKNLLAALDDD